MEARESKALRLFADEPLACYYLYIMNNSNTENSEKLSHIRHTLAHLLASVVTETFPGTEHTIGPAIDNGFYFDFAFPAGTKIGPQDLHVIETKMKKTLPNWTKWEHKEVTADEAKKHFANNPYKLELIDDISAKGEKITLYTCGGAMGTNEKSAGNKSKSQPFTDLCRGGHIENPAKEIKPDSFKITHLAGAYWKGDEKRPMLTRIYGLAFNSKDELDNYEWQIEEAKKRDHRKIGKEMKLFTISDLVGSGLPLMQPNGMIIR